MEPTKLWYHKLFIRLFFVYRVHPAIGFIVRNNEGTIKKDAYVNTVDEVERITGIDFFPALLKIRLRHIQIYYCPLNFDGFARVCV